MPTTNNSDAVALSISSRLHNFTKSGAPWIVTLPSSDFYKNLEFSFILNCAVPSLMLFYNLMQSRVVSKGKICELLGHYRRGPNLKNSFRLTIHYHAIYCFDRNINHHCPACRTTLVATRFRVAVICPIIQVPHCIRVFFYFVWFVFINHIFQFYYELCTYCNILDIYLS